MSKPARYPQLIHVSFGGPTLRINVGGRVVLFEEHRYCGPLPVDAQGNGRSLGPRHSFWRSVTDWYRLGKPLNPDGTCRWVKEVASG